MAGENDSDPYERYFRPRPGGSKAADDSDAAEVEGVAVEDTHVPRVSISSSRTGPTRSVGLRLPSRRVRRQRAALVISGTVSAVVLLVSGGAWAFQDYVLGKIQRVDAFGGLTNRPGAGPKGAMNILLAGVDRRQGIPADTLRRLHLGHQEGERSDTMMLVHLSENHDKATILSLPRDSLVTIPAHAVGNGQTGPEQQQKLNAAFSWGGPKLTIQTIEKNTGIRIHHYIEVNFLGFMKVVDALGGVEICTPQAINDPKSGLNLPAGKRKVDGATGLAYVRARYTLTGGSDLGRIDRQQQFMSSMLHEAVSTSTLTDPKRFAGFLGTSLDAVRADPDLSKDTIAKLADQVKRMSTDSVTFATVPIANPGYYVPGVGLAATWDVQQAKILFDKIKKDQTVSEPAPSAAPTAGKGGDTLTVPANRIQVRVLNGVGTPGLGARAAGDLRNAGFSIIGTPGNTKGKGARETMIQYGPGREESAKTLKAAIPGSTMKLVPSLGSRIQVIIGSSWSGAKKVTVDTGPAAQQGQHQVKARTASQNICK